MKEKSGSAHTGMSGSYTVKLPNGSTIHTNGRRILIAIVVLSLLFLPILMIFNNFVFGVNYDGANNLKDDYIAEWDAEDPRLIEHIRQHYLDPPAERTQPYKLIDPNKGDYSHKRQSSIVAELLEYKKNGFFIEAGAYDGETYSNSLQFEKDFGWTGLLVEPDFANQKRLRAKNRKAWLLRGCLEGGNRPQKMTMYGAMDIGTLDRYLTPARKILTMLWRPTKVTQVWCFPLISALLAVNRTSADYFALDVEGAEMPILKSIPFDKIDITVLQVEFMVFQGVYWDKNRSQERLAAMRSFMSANLPQYVEKNIVFLDMIYLKDKDEKIGAQKMV